VCQRHGNVSKRVPKPRADLLKMRGGSLGVIGRFRLATNTLAHQDHHARPPNRDRDLHRLDWYYIRASHVDG